MALKAILEVAQQGKDLRTAGLHEKALDSQLFLPKVYQVKKLTPVIPEGWISGTAEFLHGRGYAPMYLYYQEESVDNGNDSWFTPARYSWYGTRNVIIADSTKIEVKSANRDSYVILFLDPLAFPTTHPSSTGHGGSPRLKVGDDLVGKADYLADIDSKYQTLKVAKEGQLVCNVPAWEAGSIWDDLLNGIDSTRTDWFSFSHGLSYPPVFTPFGISRVGLELVMAYDGWGNIPTDLVLNQANDLWAEKWLEFEYEEEYENFKIMVDSSNYYMKVVRQNNSWDNGKSFPARTVRVNYVIFDLPITTEFNLLS